MLNKKRNLEPLDNIPLNKEINRPNINIQLNNNEIVQTKCEICGLECKYKRQLKRHRKTHNNINLPKNININSINELLKKEK